MKTEDKLNWLMGTACAISFGIGLVISILLTRGA